MWELGQVVILNRVDRTGQWGTLWLETWRKWGSDQLDPGKRMLQAEEWASAQPGRSVPGYGEVSEETYGLEWSEQVQQVGEEVSPWYLIRYKNFSFYPECNILNHSGFVSKMFGQKYMQRTVRILGCRQGILLVVSCYKPEHKMHLSLQNCLGHYQMTFPAPMAVAQGQYLTTSSNPLLLWVAEVIVVE